MNWTQTIYSPLTSQSDFSSTEVTLEPTGEPPVFFDSGAPQSPFGTAEVILTVIDGELCIVKDETPPGARLPNYNSRLVKLADTPALTSPSA